MSGGTDSDFLKRIDASAAGVAYSRLAYDMPSSKDVTEVEYATEYYATEWYLK